MREREIFIAALQHDDPAARRAYVEDACGADSGLRGRVEALLGAFDRAGSFLLVPAAKLEATSDFDSAGSGPAVQTAASAVEGPGTVIGPYKLLEQIGEGGMGIVYSAEQAHPVRRKVALKIIKPGMDTRQVIARFEAERQALALMDHANIARVFDAGATAAGRPYFVMELVKGVPITTYCDTVRLPAKERLELFVAVCQAIQHAHQKGIIHRDIKPSNVLVAMVDGKPTPKVIDFGVAKAIDQRLTEKTVFTQNGSIVGTLEYMSPEQAELSGLDIDTRTDIYALGVLLYELLTGTTPLTKEKVRQAAYTEVLRQIREVEPPRPSTRLSDSDDHLASLAALRRTEPARLTKQVRGELDWIVMKALDKDRTRRYETANGFARDVERYLANEPVEAGPPSAWYRVSKFCRRNRAALTSTALVASALIASTTMSLWQTIVARRARSEALAQRDRADRARADALVQRDQARKAVDEMYTQVAQKWLSQQAKLEPLQREFLLKALAFYNESAQGRGRDPVSRHDSGLAYLRVGSIRTKLGEYREAEQALRSAIETEEALAAEFPKVNGYRGGLAIALDALGMLLRDLGRATEAERVYHRAFEVLKTLSADNKGRADYESTLGATLQNLGNLAGERGDLTSSRRLIEEAIEHQRAALSVDPRVADYRRKLGQHYMALAVVLELSREPDAAARAMSNGTAILEELSSESPENPNYRAYLAFAVLISSKLLLKLGCLQDAETSLQRAIELYRQLASGSPEVPDYHMRLAESHAALGVLMSLTGRRVQAEREHRRSLAVYQKLAADSEAPSDLHSRLGASLNDLGLLLMERHEFAEARPLLEQAIEQQWTALKASPRSPGFRLFLRNHYINLARTLVASGESAAAERLLVEADRRGLEIAEILNDIAWRLAIAPPERRDPARAVRLAQKAVLKSPDSGAIWNTLGVAEYRAGVWDSAIKALSKSIELTAGGSPADWLFLAMAHWQKGNTEEARSWHRKADTWMDQHRAEDEELNGFRAEAEALIQPGGRNVTMPTGPDAFAR